jgi:multiple sugar transport system permease protein
VDFVCDHHYFLNPFVQILGALGLLRRREMTTTSSTLSSLNTVKVPGKFSAGRLFSELLKYSFLFSLALSFAFPIFWMISSAFKDDPQIYTIPPVLIPVPAHPNNFVDGWTRLDFTTFTLNSIFRYTLPVTLFTLTSSTLVAYGFAKLRWPGRDILFYICIATMMIPWQVTMVPLFITFKNLDWINSYRPLIIPALFGHPYFIFMLRQFLMSIPEELSDAARIDGANEFEILIHIMLPLMKPALAVVALFRFVWAWNDFLGPLIYLHQDELYPLALGVRQLQDIATGMGTTGNGLPHLMAVSTIVALPIILLFFLAQRTFIEGISLTGIKG